MVEQTRVLVVEDDQDIAALLTFVLEEVGLEVTTARTGEQALALARRLDPDLITLDLSLPDADGTEVCRDLREFTDAYVMMITGRTEEADRLVGLEVGADDYLVKPFSAQEVRARVRALLRRPRAAATAAAPGPATVVDAGGGLLLLPSAQTALLDGVPLPLTGTEIDLLAALAAQPDKTWSRGDLVNAVWKGEFIESDFLVDVHVGSVRRKLRQAGSARQWISTVGGTSYALATT